MAFTAGSAQILVVPVFTGFQRSASRAVGQMMPPVGKAAGKQVSAGVTAAGTTAATGFAGRLQRGIARTRGAIGKAGRAIGSQLTGSVSGAGVTAASGFMGTFTKTLAPLAAAAGLGSLLGKGFTRLANIEDAEAKLRGLGHSAETVQQVMDNALKSVEGTAFGLDEAAGVAAGLLAAGVKPGEELERVLKGVGDAATIGGTSMSEMGAIFNKVAAGGVIQGEEIAQLSDRGIPILQLLGEQMGVTALEAKEMASRGEVSFADFAAAMDAGMGGAALKSGETTRGTLRNVGAAWSRFGANIMENVFPLIKQAGAGLIDFFDNTLTPAFDRLVGWVSENKDWLLPVAKGVAATVGAFMGLRLAILGVNLALNFLRTNWLILALTAIVAGVIYLWNNVDGFREAVTAAWNNYIKPALTAFWAFVTETLVPAVLNFWNNVVKPAWAGISAAISWAWSNVIQPALSAIWNFVANILAPVILWFAQNIVIPYWTFLANAIKWAWDNVISPAFNAIRGFIVNVLAPVIKWLWNNVVKPAFEGISFAVQVAWNVLKFIFDLIKWTIENVVAPPIKWLWNNVVSPVFGWIGDKVSTVWNDVIKPALSALASFVQDTVAPGIEKGAEKIGEIWDTVKGFFAKPINWVLDTVWNNGIKKVFDNVSDAIGSDARLPAATLIPGYAKGGLAKGWAIVGEEGPELVNFASPSRVYDAKKTRVMLGKDADTDAIDYGLPMGGGLWDDIQNIFRVKKLADEQVQDNAIKWVRGGLAAAAGLIFKPIQSLMDKIPVLDSGFGGMVKDTATFAIDKVLDWVRGNDEVESAKGVGSLGKTDGKWMVPLPKGSYRVGRGGAGHGYPSQDLPAPGGTPVLATLAGVVQSIRRMSTSYGNHIRVAHGDGLSSLYAHLSSIAVKVGQRVAQGARLGGVGTTGNSTGNHLHFEVLRNARRVEPASLMSFDSGGYLPPGFTMAYNGTRKPEPVFTSGDFDRLAGSGGPRQANYFNLDGAAVTESAKRYASEVIKLQARADALAAWGG